MALTYRWDENIPEEIKKNNKKGDEMIDRFLLICANANYSGSSPRMIFCGKLDEVDEEDEEPVKPAPDPRPDWQIKNAEAFEAHVRRTRKEMEELGIDNDYACGPDFDYFAKNSIPELTTPLDYYTVEDALEAVDDYEDDMYGY